jgi:DNA-binding transcriptional ArsR family regulator
MATESGQFAPRIAFAAHTGGAGSKLVLLALALCSCRHCGLAWPGMKYLVQQTELGERAIEGHLKRLTELGLVRIHAYGQGGKRRATIYQIELGIVFSHLAPCEAHCRPLLANPAKSAGYEKPTTPNPAESAGYQSKPRRFRRQTPQNLRPISQDLDLSSRGESASPLPDSESTLRIDPSASNGSGSEKVAPRDPEWAAALERHGLDRHLDDSDDTR